LVFSHIVYLKELLASAHSRIVLECSTVTSIMELSSVGSDPLKWCNSSCHVIDCCFLCAILEFQCVAVCRGHVYAS